jgi:hypothetical protein
MIPDSVPFPEATRVLLLPEHRSYVERIDNAMSNDPEYLIHHMHPTIKELRVIFDACMIKPPSEPADLLGFLTEALHKLPDLRSSL